jgi:hypothetical protein
MSIGRFALMHFVALLSCLAWLPFKVAAKEHENVAQTMATDDAPAQKKSQSPDSAFATIMERVKAVASTNDWRNDGWRDPKLESSIETVLKDLKKAIGDKSIKMPVAFNTVRPPSAKSSPHSLEKVLYASDRVKLSSASGCIIMGDESVTISHASDCVILSRGVVDISHGRRNLVVAGQYLHTSHDGNPDGKNPGGNDGSVLLSNSTIHAASAKGTILFAPDLVEVSFPRGCVVVNAPNPDDFRGLNCRLVDHPDFHLSERSVGPIRQTFRYAGVKATSPDDVNAVLAVGQDRFVLKVGDELPDIKSDANAELKGWKLVFLGSSFALFAKGKEFDGVFRRHE